MKNVACNDDNQKIDDEKQNFIVKVSTKYITIG